MPVMNGMVLGVVVLAQAISSPVPVMYNSIKVFGQSIVDYIQIQNIEKSESDIPNLKLYDTPIWDGNTIMLANFENTLNAGNVTSLTNPILNWVVQRRKTTDTSFTTLATLDVSQKSYVDTTLEPNVEYIYQIIATNDTEQSEPLVNMLDSVFYNSVLSDLEGTIAYVFDFNLDFDGFENEVAYQRYDGFSKNSAYSFGKRDFRFGSATAILSSSFSDVTQTIDFIKTFTQFINNGQPKIFKDRKGNVLKVVTTGGVKQKPLSIAIGEQPYEISFNFEEVGEVNA